MLPGCAWCAVVSSRHEICCFRAWPCLRVRFRPRSGATACSCTQCRVISWLRLVWLNPVCRARVCDVARRGHTLVVLALVQAGAALNAASHLGETALHIAASHGHTDSVRALLTAGADTTLRTRYSYCPTVASCAVHAHRDVSVPRTRTHGRTAPTRACTTRAHARTTRTHACTSTCTPTHKHAHPHPQATISVPGPKPPYDRITLRTNSPSECRSACCMTSRCAKAGCRGGGGHRRTASR